MTDHKCKPDPLLRSTLLRIEDALYDIGRTLGLDRPDGQHRHLHIAGTEPAEPPQRLAQVLDFPRKRAAGT